MRSSIICNSGVSKTSYIGIDTSFSFSPASGSAICVSHRPWLLVQKHAPLTESPPAQLPLPHHMLDELEYTTKWVACNSRIAVVSTTTCVAGNYRYTWVSTAIVVAGII